MIKKFEPILFFKWASKKLVELEQAKGKKILPKPEDVFKIETLYNLYNIRVIIIGQDPYPSAEHACGLAFSTPSQKIPPSLRNIFKELKNDLGCEIPKTGDLTKWVNQGVLLLNTCLTVEEGKSGSHINDMGWEFYTRMFLQHVIEINPSGLVIICWGKKAQDFTKDIVWYPSTQIFSGGHPSPLNTTGSFFNRKYFSKTNVWLKKQGLQPIDWDLSK